MLSPNGCNRCSQTAHLVQGCRSCLGLLQGYSPAFRGLLDWIRRCTNRASMLPSANRGNGSLDLRVSFVPCTEYERGILVGLWGSRLRASELSDSVPGPLLTMSSGASARQQRPPCLQLSPGSHLSSSLPGDRWLPRGVVRPRSYGIILNSGLMSTKVWWIFIQTLNTGFVADGRMTVQCPMSVIDKIDRWQWRWGITV